MIYAVGEIVLVVIGILVALQLNNWNEDRKENEKMHALLDELQDELANNIDLTIDFFRPYQRTDSLAALVISGNLTKDFVNSYPNDIAYLPISFYTPIFNTAAFNIFSNHKDNIPEDWNNMANHVDYLYNVSTKEILKIENSSQQLFDDYMAFLRDNNLFIDKQNRPFFDKNSAFKNFSLEDPAYKNFVAQSKVTNSAQLTLLMNYRKKALKCYSLIDSLKGKDSYETIFGNDSKIENRFLGKYLFKKDFYQDFTPEEIDSLLVYREKNKLYHKDFVSTTNWEMFKIKDSTYIDMETQIFLNFYEKEKNFYILTSDGDLFIKK